MPAGAKGVKFSAFVTGSVRITKTVSAVTLIATRTALNFALSEVPLTSRTVISKAIDKAGRLRNPPAFPPRTSGPELSQSGKSIPNFAP